MYTKRSQVSQLDSRFLGVQLGLEIDDHGFKIYLVYNFFADNNICMV